jgi:hypothetical protein
MRDWGTYRKLYDHLPPSFERLPFAVRCLSAEILRRCDRNGRIIIGDALTDQLVGDLAFLVHAHPGEEAFLKQGLELLLRETYLEFEDGYLTIRNFVDAQRSDGARAMARSRAKAPSSPNNPQPAPPLQLLSQLQQLDVRSTSSNIVSSSLVSSDPDPDQPDRSGGAPAEPAKPEPQRVDLTDSDQHSLCPTDLVERAERLGVFGELAASLHVPVESLRAEAEGYVQHFVLGAGIGQQGNRWMRRLRGQLVKRAKANELKPLGALEHERQRGGSEPGLPTGWSRHPANPDWYLDDRGATRKCLPGERREVSGIVRRPEGVTGRSTPSGALVGDVGALLTGIGRSVS